MSGHRLIYLVFLVLALAALACNMDSLDSGDNDDELQEQPLVMLLAPLNGSTYAEGVQIEFHAVAQSSQGDVARIEFRVDDMPVGEMTSTQPDGQLSLTARMSWIATGKSGHLVTAEAFRANGSSLGLSDVSIKVVDSPTAQQPAANTTPSLTPTGGVEPAASLTGPPAATATTAPTSAAPVSGRPVARVNNATLNVRQGPGIDYPTVGTLTQNQEVEIVGRNADSTWWAIPYSGGTAWIWAGLTVTVGDTSQVPLVALPGGGSQPTTAPTLTSTPSAPADLVIDNVRLDPATPQANTVFTVYAVVRNAGQSPSPEADAMLKFQPGDELSPADPRIPALQPGESKEIFFRVTLKGSGTGLTGTIDIDIYNTVAEGETGEANNSKTVTYNVNP